jgi:hypothetical protein
VKAKPANLKNKLLRRFLFTGGFTGKLFRISS